MTVFIPQTDLAINPYGEPDWEWLPKLCPVCGQGSVIGHGRRRKQAHEPGRTWIVVRRGISKCCKRTWTVLPAWSPPGTHYSLRTRQQSGVRYCSGERLEEAAPVLADPDRTPDAATLRRWFERRVDSLRCWLRLLRPLRMWLTPPTIVAWDWPAALRILIPESNPG